MLLGTEFSPALMMVLCMSDCMGVSIYVSGSGLELIILLLLKYEPLHPALCPFKIGGILARVVTGSYLLPMEQIYTP